MKSLSKMILLLALALGTFAALGADREPVHYLYLFAYDDGQMTPDKTHTWAAYFRFENAEPEWHSISWLPKNGVISPLELGPQRPVNKPHATTLADAAAAGAQLRQFGPYVITAELYELLEKRRVQLGKSFWYRVLDTSNRMNKALDPENHPEPFAVSCMHAVSDAVLSVDPKGWLVTGTYSGIPGTAMVAWHLSDWFTRVNGDPHRFVAVDANDERKMDEILGLAKYPQLKKQELTRQNNRYCRTLQECRGALNLLGGK